MPYDSTTYATEPGNGKLYAHAYDVEARKLSYADGQRIGAWERQTFNVYANNRDQAARRVARDGWEVCSVNMTG